MAPKKPSNCPAALRHHNVMLKTFLKKNKQYTNLTVGSFIFYLPKAAVVPPPPFGFTPNRTSSWAPSTPPIEPARLLLLQRADTKFIFLDLWEVPGGGSELPRTKILDIVANRTFEQTGLHLRKFIRKIGDGVAFKTSDGPCLMLCFEIEIKEVTDSGRIENYDNLGDLKIELDRQKHYEYVWATEEEIRDEIFPVATPQHKAVMLQAFELRRQDVEDMRARALEASKVQKYAGYEDEYEDYEEEEDGEEEVGEEEDDEEEDGEEEEGQEDDNDKKDAKKADEGPDYGKVSVKHNRLIRMYK